MTTRLLAMAFAVALLAGYPSAQGIPDTPEARRLRDAAAVFGEIMAAQDRAIPEAILANAEGIAIFPSTVKAGFVFGGMRGRGVLSARTANGWSAPAFFTLTGGSFGLQIGGQAADLVLVINDRRGLENLVRNQFKFGADVGVAAGPVGRDAQASTDIQLRAQILSYSRSRGLFAGVTVNGSTIRQDLDANERFYGKRFETPQIVFDGTAPVPASVGQWLDTLRRYAPASGQQAGQS